MRREVESLAVSRTARDGGMDADESLRLKDKTESQWMHGKGAEQVAPWRSGVARVRSGDAGRRLVCIPSLDCQVRTANLAVPWTRSGFRWRSRTCRTRSCRPRQSAVALAPPMPPVFARRSGARRASRRARFTDPAAQIERQGTTRSLAPEALCEGRHRYPAADPAAPGADGPGAACSRDDHP